MRWQAPSNDGGGAIQKYQLQCSGPNVEDDGPDVWELPPDVLSWLVQGLESTTEYTFQVWAFNSAGWSPASEAAVFTTSGMFIYLFYLFSYLFIYLQ